MEKSPSWEANSHSVSQGILHPSQILKVHYRVHNSPPLVPIPIQMHPVHTFLPYFPKIHFNIIFPSTPRYSEWSLPFRFSDQNVVCISRLSHACYMSRPSHAPWLNHYSCSLINLFTYLL